MTNKTVHDETLSGGKTLTAIGALVRDICTSASCVFWPAPTMLLAVFAWNLAQDILSTSGAAALATFFQAAGWSRMNTSQGRALISGGGGSPNFGATRRRHARSAVTVAPSCPSTAPGLAGQSPHDGKAATSSRGGQ
eukprot:15431408-Alexandrium_andersonii.AAC.1